jgi:type II secretory pathway component PulF
MLPALATSETILASAIGESTGQLARCLRGAAQRRTTALWIDFVPQLIYPFAMLLAISTILSFIGYFIIPKFKKIFLDFGVDLPYETRALLFQTDMVVQHWYIVLLGVQGILMAVVILAFSSTARWFFPGLGAVYRRAVRSRVLRVMGLLLESGKPLPESFAVLLQLPLGHAVLTRLDDARSMINEGSPLGESLLAVGLLPARMLPLLRTAERAGNLPWALMEMADSLYQHTMRLIKSIMQVVFPVIVVALGVLVGLVVVSLFIPVVKLITELSL